MSSPYTLHSRVYSGSQHRPALLLAEADKFSSGDW